MQVVRYRTAGTAERFGPGVVGGNGRIAPLPGVASLGDLLTRPLGEIRERLTSAARAADAGDGPALVDAETAAPVDGLTEVWAAGVTYLRSRAARVEESETAADVYAQVYGAERPELFFKSASWRVSGDGEPVQIRADSVVDVPEPELAVVLNSACEVVGYTICNDVSSRSIEGENPLYLPQAKIFLGGCALGPAIRPAWEAGEPTALAMSCTITRSGAVAWEGTASTRDLVRRIEDLAEHLFRAEEFPEGAVLSTGTSLVPPLPFTLRQGDTVSVTVEGLGTLTNTVVRGKGAVGHLVDRVAARGADAQASR